MDLNRVLLKYRPKSRDEGIITAIIVSAVFVAVVLPIGAIIFFSFKEKFPTTEQVGYTYQHYIDLFLSNPDLIIEVTINTAIYASGSTLFAMVLGLLIAFFVEKYFPESNLQLLLLIPYGIPAVAAVTGWILLLGNNGVVTTAVMGLFNLSEVPWDIYSVWGMIWVEGLHTAPIAFLLMLPSIKAIPSAMEESSFIAGGSVAYTFRKVVVPVIWPAVLSTAIFLFARAVATVATPAILGVPDQTYTYGSAIPFLFLAGANFNYSIAMAFSVYLTVISGILIYYYLRVTEKQEKFTTVTGRGRAGNLTYNASAGVKLGIYLFIGVFVFVAGLLPVAAMVWDSLYPTSQLTLDLSQFTLKYYDQVLSNEAIGVSNLYRVFRNTITLGLIVPTTAMLLAILVAYSNQTLNIAFGRLYSFLSALALAVPGIAKGLGFLVSLIYTPLYGTIGILIVAFHGSALPIAMRYASPAITKIGAGNFEAAIMSGGRPLNVFRKMTLPLVSSDFLAGWMHLYVTTVRTVPIAILLYSTGSEVLAVELLFSLQAGYLKVASTLAVLITVLSTVPYLGLQWYRMHVLGTLGRN